MFTRICKNCEHFRDLCTNRKQGICELFRTLQYLDESCKMFTPSRQIDYQVMTFKTKRAIERCICNDAFVEIPNKKPDFRCAFQGRMIDEFRYNMLFAETPINKVIEDIIEAMSVQVLEAIEERGGEIDDYEMDAFADYDNPIGARIIINLYRK